MHHAGTTQSINHQQSRTWRRGCACALSSQEDCHTNGNMTWYLQHSTHTNSLRPTVRRLTLSLAAGIAGIRTMISLGNDRGVGVSFLRLTRVLFSHCSGRTGRRLGERQLDQLFASSFDPRQFWSSVHPSREKAGGVVSQESCSPKQSCTRQSRLQFWMQPLGTLSGH